MAEKENKDDQLFKQGIDSLLKAPMQRLLRYPLLLDRYKKEAENERIDSLSIDEINRAISSIRNIRYIDCCFFQQTNKLNLKWRCKRSKENN